MDALAAAVWVINHAWHIDIIKTAILSAHRSTSSMLIVIDLSGILTMHIRVYQRRLRWIAIHDLEHG
jgi:hypothetical protein